jgi:hypothetical protein
LGKEVEIEFGSGTLEGHFAHDDFWVGGGPHHKTIHIEKQVFGVVKK